VPLASFAAQIRMQGDFLGRMEDHTRQWNTAIEDPYEALGVAPPRFKRLSISRGDKENAAANSPSRASSIELLPEHLELFSPADPLLTYDASPLSPLCGAGARRARSVSRWAALESMELEIVKEESKVDVPIKVSGPWDRNT
jgi:hypothetical protein